VLFRSQIAASIREFGFTNPVLVDEAGGIIAGHGRVLAARKLGLERVPCLRLEGLTEAQKRAYVIADNKLALNAGWDEQMLAIEIKELQGLEFDLGLLGFDAGELDELLALGDATPEGETDADAVPEVQAEAVTRPGDVWVLGRHRVMCGDSTDAGTVALLMNGEKADMVYTDPPYGISIVSSCEKVGGDKPFGKVGTIHKGMKAKPIVKANIYAPVAGDDSIQVAIDAIAIIKKLDPSVQIIWGGNYYASHLPDSSCWIVWDKNNGESFFADAELAWTNQKTAVRIFKHTWNGLIKESEHGEKRVHPTQKPVALAEWCFEKYGNKKNTVLDLFGGSGSTLIACEKSGKTGYIMELAEQYVDVAVRRWQQFTGKTATLESTGEPFPG
jgi:16S rRNA G966 N2-methylase RsmD